MPGATGVPHPVITTTSQGLTTACSSTVFSVRPFIMGGVMSAADSHLIKYLADVRFYSARCLVSKRGTCKCGRKYVMYLWYIITSADMWFEYKHNDNCSFINYNVGTLITNTHTRLLKTTTFRTTALGTTTYRTTILLPNTLLDNYLDPEDSVSLIRQVPKWVG